MTIVSRAGEAEGDDSWFLSGAKQPAVKKGRELVGDLPSSIVNCQFSVPCNGVFMRFCDGSCEEKKMEVFGCDGCDIPKE